MIELRWLRPDPLDESVFLALLDEAERARASRFRHAMDRLAFAAAHALLRSLLSEVAGGAPQAWRFDAASAGKPRLATPDAPDLRFSLSHTRGMVACAVAATIDLGVDVEPVSLVPDALDLARASFAPEEARGLEAMEEPARSEAFVHLWTLKEAAGKATGDGLPGGLRRPAFDPADIAGCAERPPPAGVEDWTFGRFRLPGPFVLSLAFPLSSESTPVRCRQARVQGDELRSVG